VSWQELVGYAASILVAASLMMSNIWRLRWVNLVGAVTFSLYGLLVHAWPVLAVNLFIVGVDLYYIVQMKSRRDFFTLLKVRGDDGFLRKFLSFYRDDIALFFPDFSPASIETATGYFVLRNLLPVGLLFYELLPSGDVEIKRDYVTPDYRDAKNADFLYRVLNEQFNGSHERHFVARTRVEAHRRYLAREGFRVAPGEPELLRRPII